MSFKGRVKNGVIVPPADARLKEGQQVEISPLPVSPEEASLLRETALSYPTVAGLPDDLAINHDYYLHGGNKQQPRRGRWIAGAKPVRDLTVQETTDFADKLQTLAAETRDLPPDLSTNHDRYLHGLPGQ